MPNETLQELGQGQIPQCGNPEGLSCYLSHPLPPAGGNLSPQASHVRGRECLHLERGLHISIEEWSGGSKRPIDVCLSLNPSIATFYLYDLGKLVSLTVFQFPHL